MNKNLAVFAFVMLTLGTVATYSAPQAFADWLIDRSGTIIQLDPIVLGDDDVQEVEVEGSSNASEAQREQLKQQAEVKREAQKTQREESRELAKQKLERKIELNERVNKNVKNKYEISTKDGDLKVKQKTKLRNGQETETEIEFEENETLHIDQENGESVDIEASNNRGELKITKAKFEGRTRLPISVNENNELTVTRPDGTTKIVTVLPDVAVAKMIERGILTNSGSVDNPSTENVELTTSESGEPVYVVRQEVAKKFLGLLKMKFKSETEVSATDAESVTTNSVETNPWRRFLESLAR